MILVTGGTGLIGAHLLYSLTNSGYEPVALKRKTSDVSKTLKTFSFYTSTPKKLFEKIKWIETDILDYYSVRESLKNITQIYHCAATVSFQSSDKETLLATNISGTTNIVNACLEQKNIKLVHVSSIGTLGRAESEGIVTEETQWNNKKTSVYSTSKYHSEMEVWRGIAEGLNAVIVNPSIIIGPGDWTTGSPKLFTTMYNGLKFYSSGTNGFVDVSDVVIAMTTLMNSSIHSERFILNSENISYENLFTTMSRALDIKPPAYRASKFIGELGWRAYWVIGKIKGTSPTITKETAETANQHYRYSNDKIRKETGMSFITVEESLAKTAKLFLLDHINGK
ncbi:MAG: NAD-dependent epimerase/dehydratase family protein [Lentimicrobiaceae bacterium]|jgi:nucleoside-diphosphate-sugar epimerase|nr:NAD-dependent epimerase/dehydratase family protein [Lentimicrobiaceae bacterium]MCP4910215.1 NAD-dependent epimerase/dehydratase family protein [Bacteroidota bacterium]MBT3453750.1 NAD-dependent epimerase/dehydratase family protein [Lentimicrobiaceae bacterium]MBT3819429.1 NAD-dependent epimerase/dehydratase family protein [Lentimicrobiaceae bacterium]MBT4062171.1 NAD-dependent epimerase/dehydratase family protein [Lentimicrobiaceae bacterium]